MLPSWLVCFEQQPSKSAVPKLSRTGGALGRWANTPKSPLEEI